MVLCDKCKTNWYSEGHSEEECSRAITRAGEQKSPAHLHQSPIPCNSPPSNQFLKYSLRNSLTSRPSPKAALFVESLHPSKVSGCNEKSSDLFTQHSIESCGPIYKRFDSAMNINASHVSTLSAQFHYVGDVSGNSSSSSNYKSLGEETTSSSGNPPTTCVEGAPTTTVLSQSSMSETSKTTSNVCSYPLETGPAGPASTTRQEDDFPHIPLEVNTQSQSQDPEKSALNVSKKRKYEGPQKDTGSKRWRRFLEWILFLPELKLPESSI